MLRITECAKTNTINTIGDKVQIMNRKGKGEQGIIKEVIRKKNMVVIEGLRLRKRIIGASQFEPRKAEYVEVPIHVSNVMLVDPSTSQPTTIKMRRDPDGGRVRVSTLTGAIIPWPVPPARERLVNEITDTLASLVLQRTYVKPDYAQVQILFQRHIYTTCSETI